MFELYVDVLFPLPLHQSYTYSVPPTLTDNNIQVGMRAQAALRSRLITGIVIRVHRLGAPTSTTQCHPVQVLLDPAPLVNSEQIALAHWMAEQYLATPGEAVFKMFPKAKRWPTCATPPKLTPKIEYTLHAPQQQIYTKLNAELTALTQSAQHAANKTEMGEIENIKNSKTVRANSVHLLHGITGSGKTEIYIHLLRDALAMQRSALLLVPEISLTIQLIQRLQRVFGDQLALLHSGLKNSTRFNAYIQLLRQEKRIAVGTRSAVFAPLQNIGLIILDEEHDASFKENSVPRYDARQIALRRAATHRALVIFGSATPRVELSYYARSPRTDFIYHSLPQRAVHGSALPQVRLVALSNRDAVISYELLAELEQNLQRGEQSLLLLNRRGYYPQVYKADSYDVETCPSCAVSLNLHRDYYLHCHYCGFQRRYAGQTADGSPAVLAGTGTQKLEDFLVHYFSTARIERLDSDAIQKRNVLQDTLLRFLAHEIDILIGTQMIARGLDAPQVSLVGVLQAEKGLHLPDFRAAEKTFSLLTQVAGRAGRSKLKGRVIFECLDTGNPLIQAAAAQDYEKFYQSELTVRQAAFYPPFSRIVRLLCRGPVQERIQLYMQELLRVLRQHLELKLKRVSEQYQVLGPVVAPIAKISNKYREHIIIKTNALTQVRIILTELLTAKSKFMPLHRSDHLEIDIDPVDLL